MGVSLSNCAATASFVISTPINSRIKVLYIISIISANLAVFNLLPIPALDGSRMVFTTIEWIFRKPVPRKIEAIIHTVGLVILVALAVFFDIFHLVSG